MVSLKISASGYKLSHITAQVAVSWIKQFLMQLLQHMSRRQLPHQLWALLAKFQAISSNS